MTYPNPSPESPGPTCALAECPRHVQRKIRWRRRTKIQMRDARIWNVAYRKPLEAWTYDRLKRPGLNRGQMVMEIQGKIQKPSCSFSFSTKSIAGPTFFIHNS